MDQFHGRSLTNPRGGRRVRNRDKRKYECGGYFSAPKVTGRRVVEMKRTRGGNLKVKVKEIDYANVTLEGGRVAKAKILKVVSTQDNRNYARQGLVTKGALINTEVGDAIVVNRPAQDGVVNARIVKK